MLVNDLIDLFDETPGILLSGEAAENLADDVQAVVIRHMLASPNKAALARRDNQELNNAIEDVYVSDFGVNLHNAIFALDFPGKEVVLPTARKEIVVAMIRAMLLEQEQHVALVPWGRGPVAVAFETVSDLEQSIRVFEDFQKNGC